MSNADVNIFLTVIVDAVECSCCQVMQAGQVRPTVPLNRQACQLFQTPIITIITSDKLVRIEVGIHRVSEDIQGLIEKLISCLWIVHCLLSFSSQCWHGHRDTPGRIGHLQNILIQIVSNIAISSLIGFADENEQRFITD